MNVSQHVTAAFEIAASRNGKLREKWIAISYRVGSRLPNSLLLVSIQRIGELDMLLRSMEDDLVPILANPEGSNPSSTSVQAALSELWIGAVYEVLRLVKERGLVEESDAFASLAHHLRLLRIPLEKYEIAADRKLAEPLKMQRHPQRNNEPDIYTYSKSDETRAHIMPMGVSRRGSHMWQVIDVVSDQTYWLERRELSERIVSLWGGNVERSTPAND